MNLHTTLERVRLFGGLGADPSADDAGEVIDDYHRYAGTVAAPDADELDAPADELIDGDDPSRRLIRLTGWRRRSQDEAGPRPATEPAIDPRIAARRRDIVIERDVRRQKRWLAFAVATTLVALAYGITRSSMLDLDTVAVVDGTHVTADEVRAASGLRPGEPLVGLDLDGAVAGIRTLPWVATAQAERDWDGTVRLSYTERTPAVAVAVADGPVLLVDAERRVLTRVPSAPVELVTITGVAPADPGAYLDPSVQSAVDLARALTPGVRSRVAEVRVLAGGQIELGLRPSGRVVMGSGTELDRKLLAVRTVLGQVDLAQLCVLDVRVPDAPVLTRAAPCA